jgi:hypothetical protein
MAEKHNRFCSTIQYSGRAARDAVESNQKQEQKQYKLVHKFRQGASAELRII